MDAEKFVWWLNGKFEDRDLSTVDLTELESIREHLALCFTKVTPEEERFPKEVLDMKATFNTFTIPPLYNPDIHSPLADPVHQQRIC